jgi:hypothetical protein
VKIKFWLTTISAFKDHGGDATKERELTPEEELDLKQSWYLYRKFLSEDEKTIEMLDKIYGHDKHSALINTPEKRACWRVGNETQKTGGLLLYQDTTCDYRSVWTATEEKSVTGYDEYYRSLGASMSMKA